MIDAHCHLMDIKGFNANDYNEIRAIVNCGYDIISSERAIEMKQKHEKNLYCCIGIGPQKCMTNESINQISRIEKLMEENGRDIDAIGETGLDFHWADTDDKRKNELTCFKSMIKIADEYSKPIVVHSRDATLECIELLNKFNGNVMFHFFSGTADEARKIADRGWWISIPPLKSKKRKAVIKSSELEYLLVETDAPYVGKTPLDVRMAIEIIAEAKEMNFDEIERATEKNTKTFIRN